MEYITIIHAILLTFLQYLLGAVALRWGGLAFCRLAHCGVGELHAPGVVHCWLFGLLLHLSLVLTLRSVGLPILWALYLPLLLVASRYRELAGFGVQLWQSIVRWRGRVDFWLWTLLHLALGASLFSTQEGIGTPWINNYGDLAFHLGMIKHFSVSPDFPPDYHLFVGEGLSYPFFVNGWSALLWWPVDSFAALESVFTLQWLLVWVAVYALLTRPGFWLLPWVLLFGGGTYTALVLHPGEFSWQLLGKGYPWTTWLSTIWVTQRSAMLGALVCAAVSVLLVKHRERRQAQLSSALLAGALLALSPLVHTHFFLVTALFWGLTLLFASIGEFRQRHLAGEVFSWTTYWHTKHGGMLCCLVLASLPALLFFPLLLGKSSMLGVMLGWYVPRHEASLVNSGLMWLSNATPWFLTLGLLWWWTRRHTHFAALCVLFVLGNVMEFAAWEWDQLKYFIALFLVFLVLGLRAYDDCDATRRRRFVALAAVAALILSGPGLFEAARVLEGHQNYTIYSERRLALARAIEALTDEAAILASPTDHNSAATLSGRRLYTGYPGTMSSHLLPYQARDQRNQQWQAVLRCRLEGKDHVEGKGHAEGEAFCPRYLIWDERAEAYWGAGVDKSSLRSLGRTRFGDEVFEIR